jgi:hypothetical protein
MNDKNWCLSRRSNHHCQPRCELHCFVHSQGNDKSRLTLLCVLQSLLPRSFKTVALLMDLADDTKKEQRRPKNSHGQLWSQLLPKPKRENVFVCVHIIFFHTKNVKKTNWPIQSQKFRLLKMTQRNVIPMAILLRNKTATHCALKQKT